MKPYLIITSDNSLVERLAEALGEAEIGTVDVWNDHETLSDPATLVAAPMRGRHPEVVVLGSDIALGDSVRFAEQVGVHWQDTSLLLVAEPTAETLRSAMRAGIRDVLDSGAGADVWGATLRGARSSAQLRASEARAAQAAEPSAAAEGRIVVVVSSKGGTGKTTIATNIAVGLAQSEPHSTVIVDLDMEFGDVANALRITPDHWLQDAVFGPARNDAMVLKSFLSEHATGLYAVCAPESPEAAAGITAEHISHLLAQLAGEYHYVVVDTAPGLADHTLAALDLASDLVYVCGMDVPSIRGLRKEMDLLAELGISPPRQHLVLNNADARAGVTLADVQQVLGRTVDVVIPPARSIKVSTNEGVPLVQRAKRGRVVRALRNLIGRITDPRPQAQAVPATAPAAPAAAAPAAAAPAAESGDAAEPAAAAHQPEGNDPGQNESAPVVTRASHRHAGPR